MNWLRILTVVLNAVIFVGCEGASYATVPSTNITTGCVPANSTKQSAVHSNPGLCFPYQVIFPDGYCKHILGYQPIYGRDSYELKENEMNMLRYQIAKNFLESSRGKNGKGVINDDSYVVRQSCLDMVDDVYCHHYFKRCYISSRPPSICREACEKLRFKVCDREFGIVEDFTKSRQNHSRLNYPYFFDIIDCTALPFRNESSDCYYPDQIRDELNILESEDCFYGDGRGYRGNRSSTVSGYTCQSWNAQCPHKHSISGDIYEAINDSGNLCRNPGGFAKDGPWCFTTNRTVRWEYCDVPKCGKRPPSSPPSNFRGHNISSTSISVTWGDVPKPLINGILLGFKVACERPQTSERHVAHLSPAEHSWVFEGLEKFSNYSCWLRADNNFGNGTWSDELVISTNDDVPDAPPESLKAWNLSSTSLYVKWDPIPFEYRNGKILRYKVTTKVGELSSKGHKTTKYTEATSLTFRGLHKYSKYVVTVSGITRRGEGPALSKVVQTDEDVPDHPPKDITVFQVQGTDTVQVDWSPVPPEYTNGVLLGYKVLYNDVNDRSRVNSSLISPNKTYLKIKGLKTNTNYSFQVLAFTAKGNGVKSATYFARTSSAPTVVPGTANSSKASIVTAAVFSGIIVFGVVFLVMYFVRKKSTASHSDNGNGTSCSIAPYAVSDTNWINDIISTYRHGYETLDDENVPTTTPQPRYTNVGADGLPDLPPHLRDMVFEFEQLYENTHYKTLQPYARRRSLGGAVDGHGSPVYDGLQRVISSTAPCPGKGVQATATANQEHSTSQHHSVDLGVLSGFIGALQSNTCTVEMTEMLPVEQRRRRRFSVDMGQVREFLALRESKITTEEGNMASADHQETCHIDTTC